MSSILSVAPTAFFGVRQEEFLPFVDLAFSEHADGDGFRHPQIELDESVQEEVPLFEKISPASLEERLSAPSGVHETRSLDVEITGASLFPSFGDYSSQLPVVRSVGLSRAPRTATVYGSVFVYASIGNSTYGIVRAVHMVSYDSEGSDYSSSSTFYYDQAPLAQPVVSSRASLYEPRLTFANSVGEDMQLPYERTVPDVPYSQDFEPENGLVPYRNEPVSDLAPFYRQPEVGYAGSFNEGQRKADTQKHYTIDERIEAAKDNEIKQRDFSSFYQPLDDLSLPRVSTDAVIEPLPTLEITSAHSYTQEEILVSTEPRKESDYHLQDIEDVVDMPVIDFSSFLPRNEHQGKEKYNNVSDIRETGSLEQRVKPVAQQKEQVHASFGEDFVQELSDYLAQGAQELGIARYGFSIYDRETGQYFGLNDDETLPTPSINKVAIAYTVLLYASSGLIDLEERVSRRENMGPDHEQQRHPELFTDHDFSLRELLEKMIIDSSNIASNYILDRIGMNTVNAVMKDIGAESIEVNAQYKRGENYHSNHATMKDLTFFMNFLSQGGNLKEEYGDLLKELMTKERVGKAPFESPLGGEATFRKPTVSEHSYGITVNINGRYSITAVLYHDQAFGHHAKFKKHGGGPTKLTPALREEINRFGRTQQYVVGAFSLIKDHLLTDRPVEYRRAA